MLLITRGRSKRFPPEAESIAKEKLTALEKLGARCGYSSAACGTDILFLKRWLNEVEKPMYSFHSQRMNLLKQACEELEVIGLQDSEKVLDHATSVHYVTSGGVLWR